MMKVDQSISLNSPHLRTIEPEGKGIMKNLLTAAIVLLTTSSAWADLTCKSRCQGSLDFHLANGTRAQEVQVHNTSGGTEVYGASIVDSDGNHMYTKVTFTLWNSVTDEASLEVLYLHGKQPTAKFNDGDGPTIDYKCEVVSN